MLILMLILMLIPTASTTTTLELTNEPLDTGHVIPLVVRQGKAVGRRHVGDVADGFKVRAKGPVVVRREARRDRVLSPAAAPAARRQPAQKVLEHRFRKLVVREPFRVIDAYQGVVDALAGPALFLDDPFHFFVGGGGGWRGGMGVGRNRKGDRA